MDAALFAVLACQFILVLEAFSPPVRLNQLPRIENRDQEFNEQRIRDDIPDGIQRWIGAPGSFQSAMATGTFSRNNGAPPGVNPVQQTEQAKAVPAGPPGSIRAASADALYRGAPGGASYAHPALKYYGPRGFHGFSPFIPASLQWARARASTWEVSKPSERIAVAAPPLYRPLILMSPDVTGPPLEEYHPPVKVTGRYEIVTQGVTKVKEEVTRTKGEWGEFEAASGDELS